MHVVKNIQILIFYFSCYYFMLSGKFKACEFGMGFLEVNFWSRDFFFGGGEGLSEALGIFFGGGVDFCPHSIIAIP